MKLLKHDELSNGKLLKRKESERFSLKFYSRRYRFHDSSASFNRMILTKYKLTFNHGWGTIY